MLTWLRHLTAPRPRDLNLTLAIAWGQRLSPDVAVLPPTLVPLDARVGYLLALEEVWPRAYIPSLPYAVTHGRLREVAALFENEVPRLERRDLLGCPLRPGDWPIWAGVSLRLWGGCLVAAKAIARGTRSGPNTPELRGRFALRVEELAAADPIVAAGVDAAPLFKTQRRQPWSIEGVPWFSWLAVQNDGSSPYEVDPIGGKR